MRLRFLALAAALSAACSFEPPGSCKVDTDCTPGLSCPGSVCVSCPNGICTISKQIPPAGDTISLYTQPYSVGSSVDIKFPVNAVSSSVTATMNYVPCASLPPTGPGDLCITSFDLATSGAAQFNTPIRVSGTNLSSLKPNTILLVARLVNGSWVDVATAVCGNGGAVRTLHASPSFPGVLAPGTYIVYQPAPGSRNLIPDFGVALIADDGHGGGSLQVVTLYADDGSPLATPTMSILRAPAAGDLDGAAITPDGSQGAMVDGGNFILFFSDVLTPYASLSPAKIDITNYGGDGDAIALTPDGDEAIVSGDDGATPQLVVISGITAGKPLLATSVSLSGLRAGTINARDGLIMSDDGRVLMARGSSQVSVVSVAPVPSAKGPLGGNLAHSYTLTADLDVASFGGEDGRDGMACSPNDSSRAVIIGAGGIQLLTGLPGTIATPPALGPLVGITGASTATAVSITRDGKRALVGTNAGLVIFDGVDTGALTQSGPPFDPSYTLATGATSTLSAGGVPTLGITLDGQYVVATTALPAALTGTLLTIPIQAGGLGAPVGVLNNVAVPDNDQILLH